MVAAAIVYGRTISRRMDADAAERARHLAELQEARDTLEQRVRERTAALARSEESLRRAATEWMQTFEAIESPVLLLELELALDEDSSPGFCGVQAARATRARGRMRR